MSFGNRRILIAVENKVKSGETNTQTDDYMNFILTDETTKIFDLCVPIFLYPATNTGLKDNISASGKFPCKNKLYLLLNYQYLLDGVILPCQTAYCESSVSNMLEDYVACLGKYIEDMTDQTEQDKSKGKSKSNDSEYMVMAVGRKEKEWIAQLWKDYQGVLKTACAELAELPKTERFLIREGNTADEQFYRSILSYVKDHWEEMQGDGNPEDEEEFINLLCKALKSTAIHREKYYIRQSDDNIFEFISGKRDNRSLGALGYALIRQYVKKHPDLSSKKMQEMLGEIKHSWLRGGVVGKERYRELSDRWLKYYKNDGNPVCPRYYADDITNGQWTGCPLSENADNPVKKKDATSVLQEHSCPLCNNLSNEKLYNWFYNEQQGKNCTCFYDFLDGFLVKDLVNDLAKKGENSEAASRAREEILNHRRKRGMNETFGMIKFDKSDDFLYVARYWSVPTIDKLIDILGRKEYVSKTPDDPLESLSFTMAEITN